MDLEFLWLPFGFEVARSPHLLTGLMRSVKAGFIVVVNS
jgi:hypothetical protein